MAEARAFQSVDALGVGGAVLCCALWGGNPVAVKYSVPSIPAFGCAGFRFLLALPLIGLLCWSLAQPARVRRDDWWLLIVHAVLTAIQIGSFNWGTSHSEAGRASVLINVHPLIVAPLAWWFLGETMRMRSWLGLTLSTLGVVALLAERWRAGESLVGEMVVLASGVIFGVQTIAQKLTFPSIAPTTLLFYQTLLAIPLFFAYSAAFEGVSEYHFTQNAVWGLLYQGLAVSGLCFSIWFLLLKRYPASRLATLAFLSPFFGVLFGNLARGEPLTGPLLVGGVLVGLGIYLVATERAGREPRLDKILPGEDAL